MPHDLDGNLLVPGDIVSMDFKIKAIHNTEEYCNMELESVLNLWPSSNPTTLSAVNTKQVRKKG